MPSGDVHIAQLPFPAMASPDERVSRYYRAYSREFSDFVADYFIPTGALWELPLWVAHMDGMLDAVGYQAEFADLSSVTPTIDACTEELLDRTRPGDTILLSPLAQNLHLAVGASRRLMADGRSTVLGGNMVSLADADAATSLHAGRATPSSLRDAIEGRQPRLARGATRTIWQPRYRLFADHAGTVPLLRLNASHGCLHRCDFCGDAWSRSLSVVPIEVLENEVRQFETLFPETKLIYVGDKTFGQSKDAVRNLLHVFANRPSYKFVVQTHVRTLTEELVDAMVRLGVVVVEMGFESASSRLLEKNHKTGGLSRYARWIDVLRRRGIRVILNILSGLPSEDRESHQRTMDFIQRPSPEEWMYNLYNFVPYPLTPLFPTIRSRIVEWDFSKWREDYPPVFEPYRVMREESFGFFLEKVDAALAMVQSRNARTGTHPQQLPGALSPSGAL